MHRSRLGAHRYRSWRGLGINCRLRCCRFGDEGGFRSLDRDRHFGGYGWHCLSRCRRLHWSLNPFFRHGLRRGHLHICFGFSHAFSAFCQGRMFGLCCSFSAFAAFS